MKAAIFNPYFDSLGGGERYTLSFANTLAKNGFNIDIQWHDKDLLKKTQSRFGLKLQNTQVVEDIRRGDGYDLCFWLSDGSIPLLRSRKNILHFQVPFKDIRARTLINKMKLYRVNKVVCNSSFTKGFIDKTYGINSEVLYPPVSTSAIHPGRKKKIILYVGRFSKLAQQKHQDVLISAFKKFYSKVSNEWTLILAGGAGVGEGGYTKYLEKMISGFPIKIIKNPSFTDLKKIYSHASIFWSASGFEINESQEPEKVEHFGMTVVEAMSAKVVPIIYSAGGHKEIIDHGKNGFLWNTFDELLDYSSTLVNDTHFIKQISASAQKKSSNFSLEEFEKNVLKLIS